MGRQVKKLLSLDDNYCITLLLFFFENPLNPDFASSIPYGPYTPA